VFGLAPARWLAERYWDLAERAVRDVEDPSAQGWIYELIGMHSFGVGRWDRARKHLELAAEVGRRFGDLRRWLEASTLLAAALHHQGELALSGRLFGEILELARARGDDQAHVFGLVGLAMGANLRGEEKAALAHLEEAARRVTTQHGLAQLIWVHGVSAEANWLGGRRAEAEAHARRAAEAIRSSQPMTVYTLEGYAGAAYALLNLWRAEGAAGAARTRELGREARRSCRDFWRFARVFPVARPRAWRYEGLAADADGLTRRARRCWQASLRGARGLGLPFEEALALLELGRTAPDGAEREEHLRRADAVFVRMGATSGRIRTNTAPTPPSR
jgi:tetratricopeptide (TPR) repeat protein